ncbi:sensor histidine kinase [Halorientalis litorea]|uniref:sensor histidine kinase n=1 Tax=Halorientalis litorea TaxID=2931977 RepID=UPI001FF59425|nr:ATP-binding protein [Halorientalis litorea]
MGPGPDLVAAAYYGLPPLSTVLQAVLALWISRKFRDQRGTRWFVVTLAMGTLHTLFFSIQLLGETVAFQAAFASLAGFFAFCSFATFTVFAGRYTGADFHRHPLLATALVVMTAGYPVLFALGLVTDLWAVNQRLVEGPILYLAYEPGLGLAALSIAAYAVSLYTYYRLLVFLLSTSRRATGQLVLLLLGALAVSLGPVVSVLGVFPAEDLNHVPYTTVVFVLFTGVALFRFDLLHIQPIARSDVVENLWDPVLVLDGDRRVVDYNVAATRIWPEVSDDIGDSFEATCPALADVVDPDQLADTQRVTLPVDGQDHHFSVTVSTVRKRGDDGEWLSILLRDVTAVEQSRWQLEKQNDRLDQVASTISHDLRNPINVATGQLELMDRRLGDADLDDETEAQLRDAITEVDRAADRMQDIIDDILTIAREGKTVEDTQELSLAAVAREAWRTVDTGDATLTVTDDCALRAERSKLLSIFENLFRNSVEHGSTAESGPDSHSDYQPAGVTVEVTPTPDGFTVTDDGPGIPENHRDDVFEYGYTTTRAGTGLGLSIVRTMAESHGWTVELDDGYEGGTRFVFVTAAVDSVADSEERGVGLP